MHEENYLGGKKHQKTWQRRRTGFSQRNDIKKTDGTHLIKIYNIYIFKVSSFIAVWHIETLQGLCAHFNELSKSERSTSPSPTSRNRSSPHPGSPFKRPPNGQPIFPPKVTISWPLPPRKLPLFLSFVETTTLTVHYSLLLGFSHWTLRLWDSSMSFHAAVSP